MTSIELLFFFLIFVVFSIKNVAYKFLAKDYGSSIAPIMSSIWYFFGIILLYPFCKDLLILDKLFQPVIFLAVIKGVLVWFIFDLQQKVMMKSLSSGVFYMPIGLGIAVIINSFFGENLSFTAWLAMVALSIIGALFFFFGHAKELDNKHKLYFLGMVLCHAYFVFCNHVVVSASNWFIHFTVTGLSIFICTLLRRPKKFEWQQSVSPLALIVGVIFLLSEIILNYSLVKIMPSSTVSLATTLSVPLVMVLSAFIYKEGKWKEQLLFGGLAYIFCIPLLLGW